MTIAELKDAIEGLPDDTKVRLAIQPRYPLQSYAGATAYVENADEKGRNIFYIGEGSPIGYLGKEAAIELGWRE